MAVSKLDRNLSSIQFLDTLREIELFAIKKQISMPSKYKYVFNEAISKNIINAFSNAKCGNSIYVVKGDESAYKLRRNFLYQAHAYVQSVVGQFEVFRELGVVTDSEIQHISSLLLSELKMIKGVMDTDKERFRKQ